MQGKSSSSTEMGPTVAIAVVLAAEEDLRNATSSAGV
jgi:hypothetical protein